jgi:hypothetical protein
MDQAKIDLSIEALCHRGCSEVTRIIGILERNEPLPETDALNASERSAVLHELKAIMAVYDRPCGA